MIQDVTDASRSPAEQARLVCLHTLRILDTPPDPALDALTRALALQLDCPIALVSLIDKDRQWFKSRQGVDVTETPREWSFCARVVESGAPMEVPDAAVDARFHDNPLVVGEPHVRFYAGAPLMVDGHAIGAMCAVDSRPRHLTHRERECLRELASVAQACIERQSELQRLAVTEVRLSDMLRAAADFTWEIDRDRRFVWVSESVEPVLGVTASSLVGQPLWDPLLLDALGDPLPGPTSLHGGLTDDCQPCRLLAELPMAPAGGEHAGARLPLLLSAVSVLDAEGGLAGWRGTAHDMTRLLEGARRSRELEVRLTRIASQLPGVVFMVEQQPDGRLALPYASEALQRVFGRRAEDVAGDARALFAQVPRRQQRRLFASLLRSARDGRAWNFECSVRNAQGAERWIGGRALPRPGPSGRTVWYGYAADFTDRHIAAQAMAQTSRHLQQALHVGRLGVLDVDAAAGIVQLDAAALELHGLASPAAVAPVGLEMTAMPLARWLEAVGGSDRSRVAAALAAEPPPGSLTYRLGAAGGQRHIALRLDDQPGVRRRVGVCRDVTEQHQAERTRMAELKLEAARQQQTEFLSRVSHELRTPMNAILGFVDLMRSDKATPLSPRHLEWSQHVLSAGDHLMALINDLLDLTRIDSGHHALQSVALPVQVLLRSCSALLEPIAQKRRCRLEPPRGAVGLQVLADRRAFGQVLLNVLGNAIKFNREGGAVRMDLQAVGGRGVLTICDEGPGIPPAQRGKLFQPFERLGRPSGSREGSGLGLAITRRLVQAMGGSIDAEFPAAGGTCMRIALPLASSDTPGGGAEGPTSRAAVAPPAAALAASAHDEAAPRRALYAEDNPVNSMLLQSMFDLRDDWTLERVATADGLRRALRASAFDLVILDIDLDGVSGLDLVRELRADPSLGAVTCVALSANGLAEQIADAMRAGFDDYWTKPIDIADLYRRLDAMPRNPAPR